MVEGVREIRNANPGKIILLSGIERDMFANAVWDGSFAALGVQDVYPHA